MEEKVFSVVEVNKLIKRIFDSEEYLHNILLSGEVTNFKISGPHAYFNIKDNDATIFCAFFNIRLSQNTIIPKNGDKVILRGTPDFYVKGGSLSFKVTKIQPEGLGVLYLKFLELKEKLEKEGIFSPQHKKSIPKNIKRIGVVTSRTGAVIQDIINVTKRRNPYTDIVLYPVKVQGIGAEEDIAKGIANLDSLKIVDVIIVGRGGGSMEDLMAFNTEIVAKAVYNCQTPIISAVGHETDFSLCDFASDLRAPTPSAAAELATIDFTAEIELFKSLSTNLPIKVLNLWNNYSRQLISNFTNIKHLGNNAINKCERNVKELLTSSLNLLRTQYINKQNSLKVAMAQIDSMNPLKMLDKGFAKVSKNGVAVKNIKDIIIGDQLNTYVLGGEITSTVTKIKED